MAGNLSAWPTDGPDDTVGSALGSGNLTIYPLSIAGPTSRTPSSLGLGVTQLLTQVFIMNGEGALDGRILQVHNRQGKRLFRDSSRYLVDWDTATGMARMVPFYPMAAPPNGVRWPFELYFHRGPLSEGVVDFWTGEGNAEIVAGDNRGYVRVRAADPELRAELEYAGIGGSDISVRLGNASRTSRVDLEILIPVQPGVTNRVLNVYDIDLQAGEERPFAIRIDRYGGLTVEGTGENPITIEYRQHSLESSRNFVAEAVSTTPASALTINGTEWKTEEVAGELRIKN